MQIGEWDVLLVFCDWLMDMVEEDVVYFFMMGKNFVEGFGILQFDCVYWLKVQVQWGMMYEQECWFWIGSKCVFELCLMYSVEMICMSFWFVCVEKDQIFCGGLNF